MMGDATRGGRSAIEAVFEVGPAAGLSDAQLLDRFRRRAGMRAAGEAAFAALVARHGGMVLRACRRIVGDEHEAQEAPQATFLVLARRADAVGRLESVGGWLHGVATRVAARTRLASSRRRARERRGGELASSRLLDRAEAAATIDPDRWVELHEELGRLPEKFRAPLVLCYLEGCTQEQAAEQLAWPLGTVQSRLARGRARLRSRLTARGVGPEARALDAGLGVVVTQAAPAAWAEATARTACWFAAKGGRAVPVGASPAAVRLAGEVLRMMSWHKVKILVATGLVGTTAALGAAVIRPAVPAPPPAAAPVAPLAVPPQQSAPPIPVGDRIITGIVRDDQGRPLAKAWVGSDPRPLMDTWDNPRPEDIRDRDQPFRDPRGEVIPPGAVGKYFEVRDRSGTWHPVSPDDINPFEPTVFDSKGSVPRAEVAKMYSSYIVRVDKGGWWMEAFRGMPQAIRTDAEGRFTTKVTINAWGSTKLHFASGDYILQATHLVKAGDLDRPIDVTLRPTRLVRIRIIEEPVDHPQAYIGWSLFAVDAAGKPTTQWQTGSVPDFNDHDPAHMKRHLEIRLPVGRWAADLRSDTLHQVVAVDVPPGDGPVHLPDFRLPSLTSVRMVGHPAAEIAATDLDGRSVRLAEYRGKVVVLDFWATWCGPCVVQMLHLKAIAERFRDPPVVILALHDASFADGAAYRRAVEPLRDRFWGGVDLPFPVLLDRAPTAKGLGIADLGPNDKGSGQTAAVYEVSSWPSTFLIAADGTMVGAVAADALEGAIEDQLGLPRSQPEKARKAKSNGFPEPRRDVTVRGRVVGPDGRGVGGAGLSSRDAVVEQKGILTDENGDFSFVAQKIDLDHFSLTVEATGLTPRMFRIDASGEVREPLKLGVGVTVAGRVIRDGKPVPRLTMGLTQAQPGNDSHSIFLETPTDDAGRFRFEHAFVDGGAIVGCQTGGLRGGGALLPRSFRTGPEGTTVDLGDFEVVPGHKLAGRVVFADGKAVPSRTKVLAIARGGTGAIPCPVDVTTGRFEAVGLPVGEVEVVVQFPDNRGWLPAGYRLAPTMKCVDPLNPYRIIGRLDRDVRDLIIRFEPGEAPQMSLDPGRLADFKEAEAGTIEGAPPDPAGVK